MIAMLLIVVGSVLAIITGDTSFVTIGLTFAVIVLNLKQMFHGYEIQKLKGKTDA